jgi:transposase
VQPEQIVELVERLASAPNKREAIARLGISQSTFYSWQKKYSEGGAAAFGSMRRPWTKDEEDRLAQLASRGLKLKEIAQEFPLRSETMLQGRIEKLGIRLLQKQQEHRLANGKSAASVRPTSR